MTLYIRFSISKLIYGENKNKINKNKTTTTQEKLENIYLKIDMVRKNKLFSFDILFHRILIKLSSVLYYGTNTHILYLGKESLRGTVDH